MSALNSCHSYKIATEFLYRCDFSEVLCVHDHTKSKDNFNIFLTERITTFFHSRIICDLLYSYCGETVKITVVQTPTHNMNSYVGAPMTGGGITGYYQLISHLFLFVNETFIHFLQVFPSLCTRPYHDDRAMT